MTVITKNKNFWILWLLLMIAVITYFSGNLLDGKDKTIFMPGPLTSGHYQIDIKCKACHGESFSSREDMQKKCISCHGEQRKKPFDSHPEAKFTDPRNADRLENINALKCVSCHVEHQPGMTINNGLTQAVDFCIHCHGDIEKERPSHKGMEFDSCASSGCHNYHNNRALYTDFLIKHIDEVPTFEKRSLPEKEFAGVLDEVATYPHRKYPVKSLQLVQKDAPADLLYDTQIDNDWLTTAHANAGVNCSACHIKRSDSKQAIWNSKPDHTYCTSCHNQEVAHFLKGKHGMRLAQDLDPMTPGFARLEMKSDSFEKELNCNTCHQPHKYKLDTAAVDICLQCHNDKHSLAYKKSAHYTLWLEEQSGKAKPDTGVSCASCHMPRINYDVSDWLRRVTVQHNQNANLKPNEKMIRTVCANCHGLEFTLDALADKNLILNNFNGQPGIHVETMDLARKELQRRKKSGN